MLTPVDWQAPWYAPWREPGQFLLDQMAAGLPLHETLNEDPRAPVRFVAASALPAGEPYERFIFDTGTCPTRDNLHDFFNGLCWLQMPASKRLLNALHAAEIAAAGAGAARGPVRDAITTFDENGALLEAPEPLWQALVARQWQRLFVELRPLWAQARLIVFGHALLEKLAQPRKELTAHVWAAPGAAGSLAAMDRWLASQLTAEGLARKPFTPLPVLGVPLWWPENLNSSFYDDSSVFRAAGEEKA